MGQDGESTVLKFFAGHVEQQAVLPDAAGERGAVDSRFFSQKNADLRHGARQADVERRGPLFRIAFARQHRSYRAAPVHAEKSALVLDVEGQFIFSIS